MPAFHRLVVRDDNSSMTPAMFKLLIALVVLFFLATVLAFVLLALRVMRTRRATATAATSDKQRQRGSAYRRLTIEAVSRPAQQQQQNPEKLGLVDSTDSSPLASPLPLTLPEIRITFPDDPDPARPQSGGRVVVVRMGDNAAVGLGPVDEEREQLPPYSADGERFQSLDLERIGGLKEKTDKQFS